MTESFSKYLKDIANKGKYFDANGNEMYTYNVEYSAEHPGQWPYVLNTDNALYCYYCGQPEGAIHGYLCPYHADFYPKDKTYKCCHHCRHGSLVDLDTHPTPCHECANDAVDFMLLPTQLVEPKFPTIPDKENQVSPRKDILEEAITLITGDRNNQYGPPTQDFDRTAKALSAMGARWEGPTGEVRELLPHDIALIVAMVKISRIQNDPAKRDNWADLAGYTGCGWECVLEENKEDQ
jgi:hypothetical protein